MEKTTQEPGGEAQGLVLKPGKYCPSCGKVGDLSQNYCPECPTMTFKPKREMPGLTQFRSDYSKGTMLVRIYDYGDGFKTWRTRMFDEEDDDFTFDEGTDYEADRVWGLLSKKDKNLIEGAGMDAHQFYSLFQSQFGKHPAERAREEAP